MFEYTPGRCAFETLSGSGDSHRSGTHSCASSPHISGSRLARMIAIVRVVPFGTKISCISVPSTPVMGDDKGSITSWRALDRGMMSVSLSIRFIFRKYFLHSVDEGRRAIPGRS